MSDSSSPGVRNSPQTPAPSVLCFGEILWDCLPAGLFPGGAPFNVGYHLHQRGVSVHLVSAVGKDFLGEDLLRRLHRWGLKTGGVEQFADSPTGTVLATLGTEGDAHYEITRNVAWDKISASPATLARAASCQALVYGSLAQRSETNRASLQAILDRLPVSAQRIFDVNLRAPFDDLGRARTLAKSATLLKMNDDEAARLTGQPRELHRLESQARRLAADSGARRVIITAGPAGAGLLQDAVWYWEPGREVKVADTIGAGDSFLATFVSEDLKGTLSAPEILAKACRVGEWVASVPGATPAYTDATPR